MTSRRLSRGCAIIQEVPGNDDEAEREQLRAQREKRRLSHTPLARRRLSGGIPQAEPDRNVLEIYDRCIKLSAENKINRQNTWDLSLIDHIDDVIGHTGANTNFQRASCTLDASVKIYSYRVDSVHHDMFKVLGGLNRSDDNEKEDGEPTQDDHNCEDEVVNESSAPTNRSRQRNRQQQLNSHLELKPLALCVSLSELLFGVDPMFQRTASSFDEGGAKGLLMNQLNVGQRCHIVFDFYADLGQDADVDAETCNFIIPSSFLSLCSNFRDLDLEISPFTSKLRSALRDDESNFNPEEILAENEPVSLLEIPLEDSDGYNIPHDNADYDDDDDDVGDPFIVDNLENDDGFSFPDDNEHHSEHLQPGSQEAGNSIEPQTIAQHHLDQRNFADMCSANAEISSPTYSRRSTALFSEANGLNLPNLQMNKNWAGPGVCMSHWRFKGESQQNIANQDPELELVNTKLKKTRITCDIDFRAPSIPDSDLADPVRASNVLSKASYAKSASVNHLLPTDLHINQAVLFRLFHRPHFFLRPGRNASASRNIHNGLSAGGFSNDPSHFGEYLNDDDDDECAPICDDAEPDPRLASEFHFVEQPATAEKIELDFAKSVKKVDIKAVKQCLWSTLSEKTSSAPPLLIEDVQEPTTPEEWPSFRDTIQAVPVPETSREAMSVQLYFICLLHLANENDLVLKPLDTSLGDFSIGRRAIPSCSRRDQ